jgi:hypothetical protein
MINAHDATSQKKAFFTLTAVKSSNPTDYFSVVFLTDVG